MATLSTLASMSHQSKDQREPEKNVSPRETQAQTMKDAPLAVKMFTPTKGGWTDLLNSNWERSGPRPPTQDKTLPEREERHGACSCPQRKRPL